MMKIGLVKELKDRENRVGRTPNGVRGMVEDGHRVVVLPRPRPGLLTRLVTLFVKAPPSPLSGLSPVLRKLLTPLSRIPPSLYLYPPYSPQARLPYDITKGAINAMTMAMAVDLAWGYLGILSLGHGAFFALGGYAMGMYLMRQIGDRGVYGDPVLPDFMVFLNWDSLPWFWYGFDMFWFAALMVMFVPGLLAFVFGWLAFRSRVTGVYLSIITQALTYALMLAFFRNEMGFGGNNGLTDFKDILGFSLQSDATRIGLFVASGVALALGYLACRALVRSRLGRVAVAIRDTEDRTRFIGYKVEHVKLAIFTFSAMLAGLAGALYVPQVGIINPGEFAPLNSIEVVIWVAMGGRATLYGAVLGAIR